MEYTWNETALPTGAPARIGLHTLNTNAYNVPGDEVSFLSGTDLALPTVPQSHSGFDVHEDIRVSGSVFVETHHHPTAQRVVPSE